MKARILVVAFATAAGLMAQAPGGGFRHHAAASANGAAVDPVTREVKMLTNYFVLSSAPGANGAPSQVAQVTTILTADASNLQALQGTLKTERAAVVSAIKANSGIAAAVNALSATQLQIETIRATEAGAIYAILTPDQQAKVTATGLGPLYGGGGPGPGFGRIGPPR
jgi:Spy/CpxP family protein refolding chaperone